MPEIPKHEIDSERFSENSVGSLIERILADSEWSGDEPYEIKIIDEKVQVAHLLHIRRGEDWITILKRSSNNPALSESYFLKCVAGNWEYVDPYKIKYGTPTQDKL